MGNFVLSWLVVLQVVIAFGVGFLSAWFGAKSHYECSSSGSSSNSTSLGSDDGIVIPLDQTPLAPMAGQLPEKTTCKLFWCDCWSTADSVYKGSCMDAISTTSSSCGAEGGVWVPPVCNTNKGATTDNATSCIIQNNFWNQRASLICSPE